MIQTILSALQSNVELHAWNLRVINKKSYQLYFVKQNLDMNREVETTEYVVNIFSLKVVNGKEMIGSANFKLYPSMTLMEVKEKINQQVKLCEYTLNEVYKFPKKMNLKPVTKEVSFSSHSLKEAAFIAADALFEADKFDKGYINSSEIYINYIDTKYYDSNGNIFLFSQEVGQIEFVATWAEKGEEVEIYKFIEFEELDSNFIQDKATKALLEASDRVKAIKVPKITNCKLLLTEDFVKEYFCHFAYKANVDAIYGKTSNIDVGHKFQNYSDKCDKVSIRLEPTMKNSTRGASFDKEGIALRRLKVIEKGIVKNLWGSNAKSQYLHKSVNGTFENYIVGAGTLKDEELEDENYVEIVSVSGFEIDDLTGDFASEIRLAYLHQKNKEKVIITGGSFSGNVYDSINTVRFANETFQNNNFVGPTKVLLDNVLFTGGE